MAALTILNGYLKYDNGSNITELPLSLLPFCTLVDRTTSVAILLPSQGTPKHEAYIEIPIPVDSFTTSAALITYLVGLSNIGNINSDLAEVTIVVSGYIYTGVAPIGSLQNEAVWKVSRTTDATPFVTTWAGGGNFNQIIANYSTLTYA